MPRDVAPGWASLPAECLHRVLSLVLDSGAHTLGAAACVCVTWRAAAEDLLLWSRAFDAERPPHGGVRSAVVSTFTGGPADWPLKGAQFATAKLCRDAARERRLALSLISAAQPARSRSLLDQLPSSRRQYSRNLCVRGNTAVACVGDGLSWATQLVSRLSSGTPSSVHARHDGGDLFPGDLSVTWSGDNTPLVCATGDRVGFSDVEEALSLRDRTVVHPPLVRSFTSLGGADIHALTSAVDAAGRCTVAALANDGVLGFWHVWRDEQADAQSPQFCSERLAQLALAGLGAGSAFAGPSCIQLSTDGTVLASAGSWFAGSYAGVAQVSAPDATWMPATINLSPTPGEAAFTVQCTSLSFQAAGPVDAAMTGGPLQDSLVLGSNCGVCVLPGMLERGAAWGANAVLLHRSSTVHCHQQGVANTPSVIVAGDSSGAVTMIDARAQRGAGVSWLRRPNDSGGAVRSLHAYGHFLATGHNDGCARIFDMRMANNARGLMGTVAPPRPAAVTAVNLDERRLVVVTTSTMMQYDWHA